MNLKLDNGTQINLKDLDKLENKSGDNALLKFFDSIGFGGNTNNVFDKKEIEKLKTFLIEMAGADGVIDQNDIKNARLKYSSIFQNYTDQNMADDLSLLSFKNSSAKSGKNSPDYNVASGDTIPKIVEKLGYTGAEAKKYEEALEKQLEADGSFMNNKKWLMAGSNIKLLSDEKLKELGITKKRIPEGTVKTKAQNKSSVSSPDYSVVSGDTIPKIVEKLGYTGINAKKYADALDKQLEADGSYMNDKKWLMAGSNIKLLSDEKLKELGITKTASPITPEIKNDETPVNNEQNEQKPVTDKTKVTVPIDLGASGRATHTRSTQKVPSNPDDKLKAAKNSAERILQVIKQSGQKGRVVSENELNNDQKNYARVHKQLYKTNPVFIKNDSTGEVHIFFDTTNSPIGKKMGLTSIEQIFGNKTQKTNRYYQNGKIVQDLKQLEKKGWKEISSTLIQEPSGKNAVREKQIKTPLPIDIKVNPSVYEGANETQKNNINRFINTLKKQKASLMKDLNIDNDTYNDFAKLSCAIAMQETKFGKADSYKYFDGLSVVTMLKDTVAVGGIGANKLGAEAPTAVSKGLTQIKIGDWDDNPRVEKLFAKNELHKSSKSKSVQNGIEAARNKYIYTTKKLENGEVVSRKGGYFVYNNITDEDAMMYLYNGRAGTLKKGNATPDLMLYTHNIKRYKNLFNITENSQQRAAALKKARTIVTSPATKRKQMASDLSWGIGQVVFNTGLYTGGVSKNSKAEINNLKTSLIQKGYDMRYINTLVLKMQRGEISFANGLSSSEISAMTEDDLKLLVHHANSLNKKLSGISNAKKRREIATAADNNFKRAYLTSHARQVYLKDVYKSSIILNDQVEADMKRNPSKGYNTGAQQRCKRYLKQLRGNHKPDGGLYLYNDRVEKGLYTGFNVERYKGINYANADAIDILLAQNASDAANTLRTSGACLTGTKQALIGSGCVTESEMKSFNEAFQLAKFLEKHPERFTEIKYVQISDNIAREITAGDIDYLPAGCIVVFGNKSRTDVPGHAGTTNGCGQINSDETDNSRWDNFVAKSANQNGKGEHGYVRIFRLNPDYFTVDPQTNKLVPKK